LTGLPNWFTKYRINILKKKLTLVIKKTLIFSIIKHP
jgi:hypothetical protein